jgi:hypothetical protein
MTYREGAEEERPRCIPFGALSLESRGRLLAALRGREVALLADWERLPASHWAWALMGAAGLGLAAFVLLHRFGDLSASPRSPILGGLLAGAGLAATLWGLPVGWALLGINQLPRGVFLLPFDLVDTRSDAVWIYPLSRLERAQREGDGKIRLEFQDSAVYRLPGTVSGGELREQIRRAQQEIHERAARGDEAALRLADPLWEARGRWPADASPQPPPSLPWGRWLGLALAAGLALGQLLAPLAYRASDARGLATAERDADDDALLRYIERAAPAAGEADEIRWRLVQRRWRGSGSENSSDSGASSPRPRRRPGCCWSWRRPAVASGPASPSRSR